jgi:predicted DNA-binding transcriptional regulator YafY
MVWGEPQHVAIRFRADQAPYVKERTWHSSQKITAEQDGSIVLEMDVADLDEVKRWLLGFGGSSEVLEPVDLRKRMIEELAQTLQMYGHQRS